MSIGILNIALILGAAQGLLLSILIFQKHRELFANRFLALLMLGYAVILVNLLLNDIGFFDSHPHLMLLLYGMPFIVGPLNYLYAKYLTTHSPKMIATDWLHFSPFVIIEFYYLKDVFKSTTELHALYTISELEGLPVKLILFNWAIIIQCNIYLILILLLIKKYSHRIKKVFSSIEKIKLDWLKIISYMMIIVLSIFFIENFLIGFGINLSHFFSLTSLLTAAFVYAMGYLGLSKSEIYAASTFADSMSHFDQGKFNERGTAEIKQVAQHQKYEKSGLSKDKAITCLNQLLALMEHEKPYQNSELTLHQLAAKLEISSHNLSEVINTQLHQNFFDFINFYRVEEVKKKLSDPQTHHLKILSIAMDAGFNSKTSFNTIFKKHTRLTPSEFRSKMLQSE